MDMPQIQNMAAVMPKNQGGDDFAAQAIAAMQADQNRSAMNNTDAPKIDTASIRSMQLQQQANQPMPTGLGNSPAQAAAMYANRGQEAPFTQSGMKAQQAYRGQ